LKTTVQLPEAAFTKMLAQNLRFVPPDPIFALTTAYNADDFPEKVNLGQGTYKDEKSNPYILPSVAIAKEKNKGSNHEYLPILGLPAFRKLAVDLALGEDSTIVTENKVCITSTKTNLRLLFAKT